MAVDTLTFDGRTPLDLLLLRRYGAEIPGFVEATLAGNPGLAALGVYPPRGTAIVVTVPKPGSASAVTRKVVRLYD